jgi:hypothetical protein
MDWLSIIIWTIVGIILFLPPKYDPAILLNEFNERWRKRIEERNSRRG